MEGGRGKERGKSEWDGGRGEWEEEGGRRVAGRGVCRAEEERVTKQERRKLSAERADREDREQWKMRMEKEREKRSGKRGK
eukprot:3696366-Rhodomonas_salina.1